MNQNEQRSAPGDAGTVVPAKQDKGFRVMDPEKHREIASQAGSTTVKRFGKDYMRELGRRGGKRSHGGHAEQERKNQDQPPSQGGQSDPIAGKPSAVDLEKLIVVLEGQQREINRNLEASRALLDAILRMQQAK